MPTIPSRPSMMATPRPQDSAALELFDELSRWPIFDPHSHIDAHRPAARNFDEILGYHYYTELCHSAGMPAALVGPEVPPRERVRNLARFLDRIDNTAQYAWLVEIAQTFYGFEGDRITPETIEALADRADHEADGPAWDAEVWRRSNLEAVFLTNQFDDPLDGWDTTRYVPCLRTDDLVLKLHEPEVVERLSRATGIEVGDYATARAAIGVVFERFVRRGARACAISLPPDFRPILGTPRRAATAIRRAIRGLDQRPDEHDEVRRVLFWTIVEYCADFKLPFDLMIGPIRDIYPGGVSGGRDLYDRRVSLADYRVLFNHFPQVTFPISTLAPDAAAELVSFAWIFPNVVPLGHWWYANIPAFIAQDLTARLQAVPKTKQVGYYSDAYKLEFVLPKYQMYRRILAETLAEEAIGRQGWSPDRALDVARHLLIDNPKRLFAPPGDL